MVASKAALGFNTQLRAGDGGSPEAFTTVAETRSLPDVGSQFGFVEATHQQSPNAYKEYKATLLDNPQFSILFNWIPNDATQNSTTGLRANHTNRTLNNYQIVYPTSPAATLSFAAFLSKWAVKAPLEALMDMTCDFRPSGPLTLSV